MVLQFSKLDVMRSLHRLEAVRTWNPSAALVLAMTLLSDHGSPCIAPGEVAPNLAKKSDHIFASSCHLWLEVFKANNSCCGKVGKVKRQKAAVAIAASNDIIN